MVIYRLGSVHNYFVLVKTEDRTLSAKLDLCEVVHLLLSCVWLLCVSNL
jgi:hypothetical protein